MLAWSYYFGILFLNFMYSGEATAVNNVTAPAWCSDGNFYCYKSDDCKPIYVRCDQTRQCEEGEDEDNCPTCTKESAESLGKFYCSQSDTCISLEWKCDGMSDCEDGEDEDKTLCQQEDSCSSNQFDCGGGQCIDAEWRCDSQVDCQSGKDEQNCEATCSAEQVTCTPAGAEGYSAVVECISKQWRCDGERDCANGEDEVNCPVPACPEDRFNCSAEHKCMPNNWLCDDEPDCESGEDEANCTNEAEVPVSSHICTDLEFKCASGGVTCIIGVWRCDKEDDCDDGSDELGCSTELTCSDSEFMCASGDRCIPRFLICSGNEECEDGSDEMQPQCLANTKVTCDPEKEFICDRSSSESPCVNMSKVCDGKFDCENQRDESDEQCGGSVIEDPCQFEETCGTGDHVLCKTIKTNLASNLNRTVGYVCACDPGYIRDGNNNCVDDDECSKVENPVCDQLCTNEEGFYKCSCTEGYSLADDKRSCLVNTTSIHPKLLFTNRHQIRSIRIHGQGEYMPLVDSAAAVALDFDYSRQEVFYSDLRKKKLFKFKLPDVGSDADLTEEDLNIPGVDTPDGLAYDWIYRHLYWADTASNTINMACMDAKEGANSKVLYQNTNSNCSKADQQGADTCIDEPRALAVHPRKGWIFWSDWGIHPHIMLAALDGSHMEKIAYNKDSEKVYLNWPNGLALDISSNNERLYWIDAQLHTIFSCSINRCMTDITVLVYNMENIKHPYSITVFENKLYWTDWAHRHIVSANKYTGGNMTRILGDLEQPMDLKVFHPLSQQMSTNHCEQPAGEEPLCQQICAPKPWSRPIGSYDDFLPVEGEAKYSCLCSDGYTLNPDKRTCSKVIPASTTVPPLAVTAQQNAHDRTTVSSEISGGTVAVIASCSVFGVAVFIALVSLLVVRRMRLNKAKDMNFDNPVYKRTTEDKLELPRHEYQPSHSDPTVRVPLTSSEGTSSSQDDFDV